MEEHVKERVKVKEEKDVFQVGNCIRKCVMIRWIREKKHAYIFSLYLLSLFLGSLCFFKHTTKETSVFYVECELFLNAKVVFVNFPYLFSFILYVTKVCCQENDMTQYHITIFHSFSPCNTPHFACCLRTYWFDQKIYKKYEACFLAVCFVPIKILRL